MGNKISVSVDDHALVRRGFRRMLEDEPDLLWSARRASEEAIETRPSKLHPQVIVMDCALPGSSGLDATRKILEHSPRDRHTQS